MAFPEYRYVSMESPDTRQNILSDPRSFLREYPTKTIIDEVQRIPDLLSYIQVHVDDRGGAAIIS